ncbi:MAG TPA: hypothetical protein VJZ71_18680 [Phycisphaerae bacterium]|nr:hypothetical protein [Phycisphaerae bacterium]
MSEATSNELKRIDWSECCGFTRLFRSFKMAIHWPALCLAFFGVVLTYGSGRLLDAMWANSCSPAVSTDGSILEVEVFAGGGRQAVKEWTKGLGEPEKINRSGVFEMFLKQMRTSVNHILAAVVGLSLTGVIAGVSALFLAPAWLFAMHFGYAVLFGILVLAIWSLFGGACCRVAALRATRDERIGMGEALTFAKGRFLNFFFAPLMPLMVILGIGLFLFLGGLIGWIPWVGEVIVGLLFFLVLLAGFALAFVIIGAAAGGSLTFPTVAVEGSDAFDAFSRTYSYIYAKPWRTALYMLVAIGYGAICLLFVKFFVRLMLWAASLFLGFSMNWGTAAVEKGQPTDVSKLHAIWQAPTLSGEGSFWGSFDEVKLANISWFAQLLVRGWVYLLWALVAAFAISFFYSASTVIYLLLRREVDLTDVEDVYFEDLPAEETAAAPPTAPEGGTSLPVIP